MEFDIVELWNTVAVEFGVALVRLCEVKTELELLRTARTTLLDSTLRKDLNDVEQGVKQFGYYSQRDD